MYVSNKISICQEELVVIEKPSIAELTDIKN
jgi:hypothetical protein